MSFRIKTTHQLLKNSGQQQVPDKINMMALLDSEHKNGSMFLDDHFNVNNEATQQANNRPKTGSNQGMAIRVTPLAQSDLF